MKPVRKGLKPPNGDMDPKFCKGVRCLPTRKLCSRISRPVINRKGCCAVTECVKWKPTVKIPPTTLDTVESAVIDEKKEMIAAVYIKEFEEEEEIEEEEGEEIEESEESRNYASQWIAALVLIVVLSSIVIIVTLPKIPKNKKDSK